MRAPPTLPDKKDAFATIAATQRTGIKIFGPVQKFEVPWVEGMTLAQAIATATYTARAIPRKSSCCAGVKTPRLIREICLNGHDVPLEPGDTITLR